MPAGAPPKEKKPEKKKEEAKPKEKVAGDEDLHCMLARTLLHD
jgi:hypothetical protein